MSLALLMAPGAWTTPHPYPLFGVKMYLGVLAVLCSEVSWRICLTFAGVKWGLASIITAMSPPTIGAEAEVPSPV